MDADRSERLHTYRQAAQWLVLAALAVSVIYGAAGAPKGHGVLAGVAAFLAAAAPFALGVLIGFLFGIPKTRQDLALAAATDGGETTTTQANTNLEQVSDWLTKILVGVGLTQLSQLPTQIQTVAEYVAHAIGSDTAATSAVVASILVYFAIAGFLWGYLVTRLILEPELGRREPDPEVVDRLLNAKPPNVDGEELDEHDAAEVLRFPLSEMKKPEQMIAWGRAKLEEDPAKAIEALNKAVKQAPLDRRAVENLAFASLYAPPPDGYIRAIDTIRAFVEQRGHQDSPADADLYAYLAAAYGQKYRWERDHNSSTEQLQTIRDSAVAAVKRALELGPAWKPLLRALLVPSPGSTEDDLVALSGDAELKKLLDV